MSQKADVLLEGSYQYFRDDVPYSQENFKLVHFMEQHLFHVYADISSRIETGEFLKVNIRYEMTNHFVPNFVRIEKTIGKRYAEEIYKFDLANQELEYQFKTSSASQEFKRPLSSKHYLTSPSFATSAMFTLSKKLNHDARTAITLVSSDNQWSYKGPPTDKVIFAEFIARDMDDYMLNGNQLTASHLRLYEQDVHEIDQKPAVDLYLSKHFAVPYQLIQGNHRIEIKNLKKF